MNYWPDHPNLEPIRLQDGGEGYRVEESWAYTWKVSQRSRRIVVPRGFIADGASVPRFAWTLVGITPDGLIRGAALLHDFLYRNRGKLPHYSLFESKTGRMGWRDISPFTYFTRKEADQMFYRLMREAGMEPIKQYLAYRAVRWFGWFAWRRQP